MIDVLFGGLEFLKLTNPNMTLIVEIILSFSGFILIVAFTIVVVKGAEYLYEWAKKNKYNFA